MTVEVELPAFDTAPVRLVPAWVRPMVVLAASLFGAVALGLALFDFSRVVRAPGWIVPESGLIRISAVAAGRIDRIHVTEGQEVRAGQEVIEVTSGIGSQDAHLAAAEALYFKRIQAGQARLASREAGISARRQQLAAELDTLRAEIAGFRRQADLAGRRIELRRDALERVQALSEAGYASQTLVTARQSDLLTEEQAAATLSASIARSEAQIAERRLAHAALDSEARVARDEWEGEEAALLQLKNADDQQSRQVYTASADSVVVALPRSAAGNIPPGTVLAVLAPTNSPLEVELLLPPSSASHVREGQPVRLLLDAFPREKSDPVNGSISYVSPAVLAASDIQTPGLPVEGPAIRVRVQLDRTTVRSGGRDYRLAPGMLLTGVVELERRSFIDAVFGSITQGLKR